MYAMGNSVIRQPPNRTLYQVSLNVRFERFHCTTSAHAAINVSMSTINSTWGPMKIAKVASKSNGMKELITSKQNTVKPLIVVSP